MKKKIFGVTAACFLGLMGTSAMADTYGAGGYLNWSGSVVGEGCKVEDIGLGQQGDLSYDMGSVAVSTLGLPTSPAVSATPGANNAVPTPMQLKISCDGVNATLGYKFEITPMLAEGSAIGVTGSSENVALALTKENGDVLDFSNGSVTLSGMLTKNVDEDNVQHTVNLNAYFTRAAEGVNVTPGTANARATYVMTYN